LVKGLEAEQVSMTPTMVGGGKRQLCCDWMLSKIATQSKCGLSRNKVLFICPLFS
jgi:hypothetical protein